MKNLLSKLTGMMSGPAGYIVGLLFDRVIAAVTKFLTGLWARYKRTKEIKEEAKESVKPLEEAKTAEEIDAATDDALNGF